MTAHTEPPSWFRRALAVARSDEVVTVDGADVHYLAWGERGRPGLVFVHGGGAHAHWWAPIAATFAPSFRVIALDLTGHGDSDRREVYSFVQWTREVMAVAAHGGIAGRPVIIGHSMGGFVTIATAAQHSDELAGVIVCDSPVTEPDPEIGAFRSQSAFGHPKLYATKEEAAAHFRTVPPQRDYLDYVLDHVVPHSLREVDGGWQWKFDRNVFAQFAGGMRYIALPYLRDVHCRLALLRSQHGLVTKGIGEFMYEQMGRVNPIIELPAAGHHAMLDQPLILLTALRTLLADWQHSEPHRRDDVTAPARADDAAAEPATPPAELAAVRPGEDLDWTALATFLRSAVPGLTGEMETLQFPNGSANLTYLLRFGDTELVLRRPPFGVVAPGAHDMKREYRVLSRLWRIFDRAPRPHAFCDDHSVIGSDFVVMERRHGEVVRDAMPAAMAHHADVGRRIGFALVDAMADMHLLDPAAAELEQLGRPDGFAARQVAGWATRWQLVRPEDGPPEMDELPERLAAAVPAPTRVSIVHNDLKLDNCQFDPADPDRVQSIFDWDMTTLGEPLVDLGTLLNYWPDPSDPPDAPRISQGGLLTIGLPTRQEVTDRYAERTGLDVTSAGWYEAFAQWKTGVVIQQLHNRWVRGESTDPRMETIADRLPILAASATRLLDGLR